MELGIDSNLFFYRHAAPMELEISRSHVLTFSRSHVLTFSRSHVLTFSHSHILTFSHSHILTFSRSHSLTLSRKKAPCQTQDAFQLLCFLLLLLHERY